MVWKMVIGNKLKEKIVMLPKYFTLQVDYFQRKLQDNQLVSEEFQKF